MVLSDSLRFFFGLSCWDDLRIHGRQSCFLLFCLIIGANLTKHVCGHLTFLNHSLLLLLRESIDSVDHLLEGLVHLGYITLLIDLS